MGGDLPGSRRRVLSAGEPSLRDLQAYEAALPAIEIERLPQAAMAGAHLNAGRLMEAEQDARSWWVAMGQTHRVLEALHALCQVACGRQGRCGATGRDGGRANGALILGDASIPRLLWPLLT